METACLLGNGVSIAYNSDLTVTRLTSDLIGRFKAAGVSAPEAALSRFASRVSSINDGDFEALLGPLESVADALTVLPELGAIAADAPADIERALSVASSFLTEIHRAGVAITLGHIAERTIGGDFYEGTWPVAAALIRLGGPGELTIGTLNYDGLLHAGLMNAGTDDWGRRTFHIADMADGRRSQEHEIVAGHMLEGHPFREIDDLPRSHASLLQLHGSLGWLRHPERPDDVWKFPLGDLRGVDYWAAWRAGKSQWSPAVVLTDQKERVVAGWPFALAYDTFLRRLVTAERWLVAGYGMGDTPVNNLYRSAMKERVRQDRPMVPPTLVVGFGESVTRLKLRAQQNLGLSGGAVQVSTSGVPDVFETEEWANWSAT